MAYLDQNTGIYYYDDGSTYQNPYKYGDSWSYNPTTTQPSQAVSYNNYAPQPEVYDTKPAFYTPETMPAPAPSPAPAPAFTPNQSGAVWGGSATPQATNQLATSMASALSQAAPPAPAPTPAPTPTFGPTFGPTPAPAPAPASSGTSNAGQVAGISGYTAGMNPYLQQQGDALTRTITNNLQNNILPGISAASIANGNFGGSRQGVMEANALNDANGQIASGLASLYGNGYNNALQYDLGRRSQDQSYNLGLGNLGLGYLNSQNNYNLGLGNLGLGAMNAQNSYDLGLRNNALGIGNLDYQYANLDRQIYNDNSNRQLQGAQLGLQAYNQGQQNNQGAISAGTNIQNTPYNYWSQFANGANSIGNGYGTTTGSTSNQGNPFLGALGGAQLGASIFGGGKGGGSFDPFGLISF